MANWQDDDQFEDVELKKVRLVEGGWDVERVDGWSMFVPAGDATPAVGSTVRVFGKGIGFAFRGLVVDGVKVFYRTEGEEEEHREIGLYGADAQDMLSRWDAGQSVFTIERGGLGPGYEQAIQVAMFEALRSLIAVSPDASVWSSNDAAYRAVVDHTEKAVLPILEPLGLSGAQWGAAMGLAARLYRDGPRETLKSASSEMRIQVCRDFPSLAKAAA